jgi:hypothetical protein
MAAKKRPVEPLPEEGESLEFPIPADGELNLENFLTSEWGANLTTATDVQRAACRVIDGNSIGRLALNPDVVEAFGGNLPTFDGVPDIFIPLWAIRGAKSMMCAGNAIVLSQKPFGVDLKPGDSVRVPIVSTEKDTAKATFQHLSGVMNSTGYLRSLIVKETADSIIVRHPTGRQVDITVVALSRAGSSLVGRWMPGVIFDEAPRMGSDAEFVRSLKESFNAVQGRIMPGGTIMLPGSPYKPIGMIFELFERYFGSPSKDCVVMRATGPKVNPKWWTPENCERLRRINPKLYRRDVLAEFDDADDSLFSYPTVDAAMKLEAKPARSAYVATLFPASHRAAWTLVVLETWTDKGRDFHRVVVASETDEVVMAQLADTLRPLRLDSVMVPVGTSMSMLDDAEAAGMVFIPEDLESGDLLEQCRELQTLLDSGRLFLPVNKLLRGDLIRAQRLATPDGNARVSLPEDEEGRRCDFAPLLARALKCAAPPPPEEAGKPDDLALELQRVAERNGEDVTERSARYFG